MAYFWVDNFDVNVENQTGGGAINSTHLVAFQEEDTNCYTRICNVSVDRIKKRTIEVDNQNKINLSINVNKNPTVLNITGKSLYETSTFCKYFTWMMLRKLNSFDQLLPTFSGWQLDARIKVQL